MEQHHNKTNEYHYNLDHWDFNIKEYYIENVEKLDTNDWLNSDALHRIFLNTPLSLDLIVSQTEHLNNNESILVCFSGAVSGDRKLKPSPIFSGLGVAKDLKIPLISIADPTLALSEKITLGWYAGNKEIPDLLNKIAKILDQLTIKNNKKLIIYGGSGGGFASLAVAQLMENPVKVIVFNPQTQIINYIQDTVLEYLNTGFNINKERYNIDSREKNEIESALSKYVPNNSLNFLKFHPESEILYFQNYSDWHTQKHAVPFFKMKSIQPIGDRIFINKDLNIGLYLGNWGIGHAALPKEMLYEVLQHFNHNLSIAEILKSIEKSDSSEHNENMLKTFSLNEIPIDNIKNSEMQIAIAENYKITRKDSFEDKKIKIILEIASNNDAGEKDLLFSINYNKDEESAHLKAQGFSKSSVADIGYFKYIFTQKSSIYRKEINLVFPEKINLMNFKILEFHPKGKSYILSAKIVTSSI